MMTSPRVRRELKSALYIMEGGVTLETFLDFLVLCESNGLIELKLSPEELKGKLQSLLGGAPLPSMSPAAFDCIPKGERSSLTAMVKEFSSFDATPSQSLSFDLQLSAIKTPEIVSTPLTSAGGGEERSTKRDASRERGDEGATVSDGGCTTADELVQGDVSEVSPLNGDSQDSSFLSVRSTLEQFNDSAGDGDNSMREGEESFRSVKSSSSSYSLKKPLSVRSSGASDLACDLKTVPYFDLEEEEGGASVQVTGSSDKDDVNVSGHDEGEGRSQEDKPLWNSNSITKEDVGRSCDSHVISVDSSDDDADDQLENLFSHMKIQSSKKSAPKHVASRKSLSVFIVSDSEEVVEISDDEENLTPSPIPNPPDKTTPFYHTPCTPSSGIMFWGSPSAESANVRTTGGHGYRRPLGEQNYYDSPSASSLRTPVGKPTRPPPALTTPSANKNFTRFKTTMIHELYDLFNTTVFDSKLPPDMKIIWNKKLRTTAGYCCYQGGGLGPRTARIELSTKVVDCFNRIRDTLVHELCHAATWIIDGIKGGGHGREWRAWADKANSVYPDLKPITRCHSYDIQYKYTYKCTTCDFTSGRHSKSVNLTTARCPYCLSKLELLPRLKVDGTPLPKRKLNRYAQFVKDHYSEVKSSSPWRTHKEIMERLKDIYHQNTH